MEPESKSCDLNVDLSGGLQERLARVSAQLELTLAELVRLAVVNQLPDFEAEAGSFPGIPRGAVPLDANEMQSPPPKMNKQVSGETIEATQHCLRDFACLKEGGAPHCQVEHCVNGNILFVHPCGPEAACSYRHPFGYGHYCICPVRKELYANHKI
jgi:hypothetical protein